MMKAINARTKNLQIYEKYKLQGQYYVYLRVVELRCAVEFQQLISIDMPQIELKLKTNLLL